MMGTARPEGGREGAKKNEGETQLGMGRQESRRKGEVQALPGDSVPSSRPPLFGGRGRGMTAAGASSTAAG